MNLRQGDLTAAIGSGIHYRDAHYGPSPQANRRERPEMGVQTGSCPCKPVIVTIEGSPGTLTPMDERGGSALRIRTMCSPSPSATVFGHCVAPSDRFLGGIRNIVVASTVWGGDLPDANVALILG
jgi:hypothetical protein